jgi:hypothetical protein
MKDQIKYLQNLLYELLNDYGKVFILVKYSANSIIGSRGFSEEEKKSGIVLVFNNKNNKDLQWMEDGSITATLGFGVNNKQEKCFLHVDDIVSVFSPDARVKFDRWDMCDKADSAQQPEKVTNTETERLPQGKIISLDDFRKAKD